MVTFLFWASQWPGHTFKVEKTNEKLILKSRHFWKVLGTQRVNKTILWSHNYLLEVIPVISVDTEAVSLCQNTNARVAKTLELINWYVLCRSFAIKSLIWTCYIRPCLPPVERAGLPYFKNYLNPNLLTNNDFLCIPLCDGIHFQNYVINSKEKRLFHFDSLHSKSAKNPTSEDIATILFGKVDVSYESYFTERKQFDANSCGVWLTAAITSFILQLPVAIDRNHAFDICYSFLEREIPPNYVKD